MLSKISFWKAVLFTVVALLATLVISYAIYAYNKAFPEGMTESESITYAEPETILVTYESASESFELATESIESTETVGEIYSHESISEALPEYPE